MPKIKFQNKEIECKKGDNLLSVLKSNKCKVYNGEADVFNCRGLGTCGTCAVEIKGRVSSMKKIEKIRLSIPPHHVNNDLRLACQCKILGNLEITKHKGFWGHIVDKE